MAAEDTAAASAEAAESLHDLAQNAESALEKLATGLAQAGAGETTIKAVSQMAEVTRRIVSALGTGQEETGDDEPPAQESPRDFGEATDQMVSDRKAARQPQ